MMMREALKDSNASPKLDAVFRSCFSQIFFGNMFVNAQGPSGLHYMFDFSLGKSIMLRDVHK